MCLQAGIKELDGSDGVGDGVCGSKADTVSVPAYISKLHPLEFG